MTITSRRAARIVSAWERDRARRGGFEPVIFENTATGIASAVAAGPAGSPTLPPLGTGPFSSTPWEDFELGRVDIGGRVLVPDGAMFTNGSRAWRCEACP